MASTKTKAGVPMFLLASLTFFMSQPAFAKGADPASPKFVESAIDHRVFIGAHHMIEILSFDPDTGTYHVLRPEYPNSKNFYVLITDLAFAVKTIKMRDVLKNPKSIVGRVYSTDKDLPLQDPLLPGDGK